jgi:hypothetical protein
MAHPHQGAPIIDHHDHVLSKEGRHVSPIWDFIKFHASGEGSRGHEILHHVVVHELVLDGVSMVRARLVEELLKVVCGQPWLVLAAACGSHDTQHIGATRLLVVATGAVDHDCSLLKTLLTPFPSALGALPSVLDGDIGWRLPAGGILGGDAKQLIGGIREGINQCLEGLC